MNCVFRTRGVRLFHGDCLEVLESLPEQSVDLVFADPPYNLSNDGISCHAGRVVSVNKGEWDRSRGFEEDYRFHVNWIAACHRVLKPNGSLWVSGTYHSVYLCGHALAAGGWAVINDVSWVKPNPPPSMACRNFTASQETLIWAKKSKKAKHHFDYEVSKTFGGNADALNTPGKQTRSVWMVAPPSRFEKRFGKHPTQKPEELLRRVVLSASRAGDLVLDPFCGSGTTGVAAVAHARRFVGIDTELQFLQSHAIPRLSEANGGNLLRNSQIAEGQPIDYLSLSRHSLLPKCQTR